MEEKVLYVKLPENAKYRRVKITEDGIGIVYSEDSMSKTRKEIIMTRTQIPKPRPLIGAKKVYQKEDVPYWYCRIKNGRDEFMQVYMEDLKEEDLLYDFKTGKERKFLSSKLKEFKENALIAIANKPREGYRWIPVFEPSLDGKNRLQFVKGKIPLTGLDIYEWKDKIREYSLENESHFASKNTYFLLLLRWLKDGFASLEQLAMHSEEIGHFKDSENAKDNYERTGERKFGGLYGFVGNTRKIVISEGLSAGYLSIGGMYSIPGDVYSLATVDTIDSYYVVERTSLALIELI